MNYAIELEQSLNYLNSEATRKSLAVDAYWPKWNSTWWHMLLLYEMGLVNEIPQVIVEDYVRALNRVKLKIFPIQPEDMPAGLDPYRDSPCHCQLGNAYKVLAARGVDVDQELPWIRPWFLRYQMPDGGMNCDNEAYLVKDEVPSSMVGLIAAFEAVLLYTNRVWTTPEFEFLKRGADFLMVRELRLGSPTQYNASERTSATDWMKLCFPRFYLYDVLRGLNALLIWSEKTGSQIPAAAISTVVQSLAERFPEDQVRIGRQSYEGTGTILPTPSGEWIRKQPATFFPLLQKVSAVGEFSPFLSRQWSEARTRLQALGHSVN